MGVRSADCGECDAAVDLGLLTEPECPHCRSRFADVEKGTGFFGSNTLVTGDAPAIEGSVGVDPDELDEVVAGDDDAEAPPTTLSGDGGDPP
jgi:hypothetical protein